MQDLRHQLFGEGYRAWLNANLRPFVADDETRRGVRAGERGFVDKEKTYRRAVALRPEEDRAPDEAETTCDAVHAILREVLGPDVPLSVQDIEGSYVAVEINQAGYDQLKRLLTLNGIGDFDTTATVLHPGRTVPSNSIDAIIRHAVTLAMFEEGWMVWSGDARAPSVAERRVPQLFDGKKLYRHQFRLPDSLYENGLGREKLYEHCAAVMKEVIGDLPVAVGPWEDSDYVEMTINARGFDALCEKIEVDGPGALAPDDKIVRPRFGGY